MIIGNGDYATQGRDIPDVKPAYADAEGAKRYAIEALGIREGNIIFLEDATGAQITRVFGSERDHRGQLYDWVKPGKSKVFVYYAGHGASGAEGTSYLVPADADGSRVELNGYPLPVFYHNLGQLPAAEITVVLEACFSGLSQAGAVLPKASGLYVRPRRVDVPAHVTVVAAGAADQVASWEQDGSHGLFTPLFSRSDVRRGRQGPCGQWRRRGVAAGGPGLSRRYTHLLCAPLLRSRPAGRDHRPRPPAELTVVPGSRTASGNDFREEG